MFQYVRQQESELELEDEVDLVMSSDIVAAQLSTKTISFAREKAGWIWKEDRAQKVRHTKNNNVLTDEAEVKESLLVRGNYRSWSTGRQLH
jgi:hypothetical protein